jgi:catalase-peroxidase
VANPLGEEFNYAEAFKTLDLAGQADIAEVLTTSQDWWPADFGHYGPLMIRMAWHSAGTYRISDGRGGAGAGQQRFAPLNSWPDNVNLDKARRLLWPVKKKYGQKLSWADLMVLTGNVALESMGFETFGFAGGREDVWEPDEDVYWGPETEWLGDERYTGDRELEEPLGAVQMGLIYVNPEGPNGNPDPLAAARDIRETFRRMAMNDEETVALIAGGTPSARPTARPTRTSTSAPSPRRPARGAGPRLEEHVRHRQGRGRDHQRPRGHLDHHADPWDNSFFENLFGYEWELTKSPAGAHQWQPKDGAGAGPSRPRRTRRSAPADDADDRPLAALRPGYEPISRRFHENPDELRRRLRPRLVQADPPRHGPGRPLPRPEVPAETLIWQDPLPAVTTSSSTRPTSPPSRARSSPRACRSPSWSPPRGRRPRRSAAATSAAAPTARASASSRRTAGRSTTPTSWRRCCAPWRASRRRSTPAGGKKVSLADLIVLAGGAAVEQAAKNAGFDVEVPFTPGRTDASQEQTDVESFAALEPRRTGSATTSGRATGCRPSTC